MSVATFSSCDLDQPTVSRHPLRVAALWSLLRKKAAQRNLRRQLYGIEPRLLEVSRALRLSTHQRIFKIVIPAALPRIASANQDPDPLNSFTPTRRARPPRAQFGKDRAIHNPGAIADDATPRRTVGSVGGHRAHERADDRFRGRAGRRAPLRLDPVRARPARS